MLKPGHELVVVYITYVTVKKIMFDNQNVQV